ncbi:HlyD family type I secretion periplasmic adaptor subunit [Mesorhizobium sp. PUT5]|uniref:HlyD family type I secretion periplasmic adaptor subunit n=1 Tax=Mesorhizobium sp. PUT5 TaxID=3454629 RepID=UPI003FA4423B
MNKKNNDAEQKKFSPAPYITAGYITLLLTFGVFGTWAATAPLASAVVASGTVSVESNRKTVQHLEGGIVSEIVAKEGEIVKPGDIVLKLDPTQAQGAYSVLRNRLSVLRVTEARLNAESASASAIELPQDLQDADDATVKQSIKLQQTIFDDRKRTRDGQIAILNDRISQLGEAVDGLDQQRVAIDNQVSSLDEEIERLTKGKASGVVATNQLASVTRARLDMQGNHGQIASEIAKLRQTISETKLQIVQVNQEYVERAGNELRDIRDQLNETGERTDVARDVLQRTVVRAPVYGMLQNIRVHTIGGVIRAAEPVLDIIPLDDDLIVTAKIRPIDIDSVHVGLDAEVRFSSFSARTTPAIFGKVTVLSQDVIEPTQAGQEPYYQARIQVDTKTIPLDLRGRLLPGMPADVIVATGERTLVQYLVKPLTDTFHKSMKEK